VEAEKTCKDSAPIGLDGGLVSISTPTVTELLKQIDENKPDTWTGGYRVNGFNGDNGKWAWADGSPFVYTNWNSGEPNNSDNEEDKICVYKSGLWNDCSAVSDGYIRPFICQYRKKGLFSLGAGTISSSVLLKTFPVFGPYYKVEAKIKFNKYLELEYGALWHFTTGYNCCNEGSRIPGIFQHPKETYGLVPLQVSTTINGDGDYFKGAFLTTGVWYTIVVSQMLEGSKVKYKVIIDGRERVNVVNYDPKTFYDVHLYQGSPTIYEEGERNLATPDVSFEYFRFYQYDN